MHAITHTQGRLYLSLIAAALLFAIASSQLYAAQAAAPTTQARMSVTAQLDPVGDAGVSGTATLTTAGDIAHAPNLDDATQVVLDIGGLQPGATVEASLHAGSCDVPGASAAALPGLTADAMGRATATGMVLFRGTENVAFSTITDGDHIIRITSGGSEAACGSIPAGSLGGSMLAAGEDHQVIRFNPEAALQRQIFADGFVPNSPEFRLTFDGSEYVGQRAEHLGTGAVRVYYVLVGDWNNVQHVERGSGGAA